MFQSPKVFRNTHGFSLVGTLVALGISGIVLATILSTVTMGWGQLAQQEVRANRALLIEEIKSELTDGARCKIALADQTPQYTTGAGGSPLKMKFASGVEVAAGISLSQYGLQVKSFKFISQFPKTLSPTLTSHYGDVVLTVDATKNKTIDFGQKPVGKMTMVVNNVGKIIECNMSGANTAEEICETLGGNWDGSNCKLPSSALALEELCASMGGKWKSNACQWPNTTVASATPTPTPTSTTPTGPTKKDPNCFDRNENVTWCVTDCAKDSSNATEKWTLINKVSTVKVNKPFCPKVGYQSTCRYKVTCIMK